METLNFVLLFFVRDASRQEEAEEEEEEAIITTTSKYDKILITTGRVYAQNEMEKTLNFLFFFFFFLLKVQRVDSIVTYWIVDKVKVKQRNFLFKGVSLWLTSVATFEQTSPQR